MLLFSNYPENESVIPDYRYTNMGKSLPVTSSLGFLFPYLYQLKILLKRSCWLIYT